MSFRSRFTSNRRQLTGIYPVGDTICCPPPSLSTRGTERERDLSPQDLVKLTTQTLRLLGRAANQANNMRRDMLRPHLWPQYQPLCRANKYDFGQWQEPRQTGRSQERGTPGPPSVADNEVSSDCYVCDCKDNGCTSHTKQDRTQNTYKAGRLRLCHRASHIKMEGARFLALLKWPRGVIAPLELAPLKITRGALSNQNVKCFISHHSLISLPLMHIYAVAPKSLI